MRRVVCTAGSLRVRPLRKSFKRCNMQIAFPRERQLTFDDSGVDFPAIVDGRRIPCRISGEALDDHFNAEREGTLHAFLALRRSCSPPALPSTLYHACLPLLASD